ncbi:spore germination protein GerW family protein [Solihabitans fulvus]|uniref:spore germination protein GerW family protein n=1 Tax=Solihabitans fulvus TaxID=1892852 RepID=UPI001CB768BB|nr:spore germination protein GerW family protein [Solihabitans fulvus]
MRLWEIVASLPTELGSEQVFGEPFETADGTTIIPVARIRGGGGGRTGGGQDQGGELAGRAGLGFGAAPAGVFVVKDGKATWEPAFDATAVHRLGALIGLAAVVLFGVAAIRRPPWPDVRIKVRKALD